MDQIAQVEWAPHDGPQYKPGDTWKYWKAVPDHPVLGSMGCLFVSGIQGGQNWWWELRGVAVDPQGRAVSGDFKLQHGKGDTPETAMALAEMALLDY